MTNCKHCGESLATHGDYCRCKTQQNNGSPAPSCSQISDADRLNWLQRHIRGGELNRMGLTMNWTGDREEFRQRIDAQIKKENTQAETPSQ